MPISNVNQCRNIKAESLYHMEKISENNSEIVQFPRAGITEYFIHTQKNKQISETESLHRVFDFLTRNQAQAVAFRIFAGDTLRRQIVSDFQTEFDALSCPITWICQDTHLFAVQVQATSQLVTPIKHNNTVLGCTFEDDNMTCHQLSLLPDDLTADRSGQAANVFEKIQTVLKGAGLDFSNTVRTWLFTHDILAWYDKLNAARDNFFRQYDIFNKLVPASTGVGVTNPAAAAISTEALAVTGKSPSVIIGKVESPMQCSALDYRSSFSRATLVETPDHRRLYVSGTASIAPGGKTVFLDDTEKQIDLSMQVATALIRNANMDWDNIVRGIMYFKDAKDFDLFDQWCEKHNLSIPHIKVQADICRDDLLFELEIDGLAT